MRRSIRRYTVFFLYNEKSSDFQNFTTENGLPGNNIFGMLEDEHGKLWLSTENGISKYDPEKNKFLNYNKNDGLICKEFNYNSYLKDHSGNMDPTLYKKRDHQREVLMFDTEIIQHASSCLC